MKPKKIILWMLVLATGLLVFCTHGTEELVAFTHVNLVPMTSEIVIYDQTVITSSAKILAIGNSDDVHIPADAQIIDGDGAYLMPGLADMHMHTRSDWEDHEIWPVHPLHLYLANGVTTIRDFSPTGSPLTYALKWRDEIRAGVRIGPTIYGSGKLLYASPMDDTAGIVQLNHDLGFDFLKLYSYLSQDDFIQAMAAAKELGMYTTGHIPFAVGLDGVLAEELDEIAHVEELLFEFIEFDKGGHLSPEEWISYLAESAILQFDLDSVSYQEDFEKENIASLQKIADLLQSRKIPVCTTMVVDDIIQQKLFNQEAFLDRAENRYFENGYLESFQAGIEKHLVQCQGVENICTFKYEIDLWILNGLHAGNVQLLLGTDSGTGGMGIIPGFSIHDELRILVENGFSPFEAIQTGTVNAAKVVKRMTGEGNFGTIEIGKRADLILVAANPLEDLEMLRSPLGVMAAGKWFSEEMLSNLIDFTDF